MEKEANKEKKADITDSLKKNVKKLLPRRIEFVLAKTAEGAKSKTVGKECVYTRQETTQNDKKKESEVQTEEKQDDEEEGLLLFKKTKSKGRFGSETPKEETTVSSIVAPKSTQLVSNSARDWLNLPKRSFAKVEPVSKKERIQSKPLPSAEEMEGKKEKEPEKEKQEKKQFKDVFSKMVKEKKKNEENKNEIVDWGDNENDYATQIESSRREVLKEWEEMRKPDEWDMALDQGKTKKVKKNKVGKRKFQKQNPFQEMAQKKQKKSF